MPLSGNTCALLVLVSWIYNMLVFDSEASRITSEMYKEILRAREIRENNRESVWSVRHQPPNTDIVMWPPHISLSIRLPRRLGLSLFQYTADAFKCQVRRAHCCFSSLDSTRWSFSIRKPRQITTETSRKWRSKKKQSRIGWSVRQ